MHDRVKKLKYTMKNQYCFKKRCNIHESKQVEIRTWPLHAPIYRGCDKRCYLISSPEIQDQKTLSLNMAQLEPA